jgi:hypothetical protein
LWYGKERGSFGVSKGWFENTKKQMNLCSVNMITESVSTHHVVGTVYPVHCREIDETGQFWNKMPMLTFVFESEKICLKVPENCVTLFIFPNAWGWNLSNKYQHKNVFIFISH